MAVGETGLSFLGQISLIVKLNKGLVKLVMLD